MNCQVRRSGRLLFLLLVLLLGPAAVARAENETGQKPLRVTDVRGTIALRHFLDVTVEGLPEWSQQSGHDPSKFVLIIDGTPIEGVASNPLYNNSKLRFDLNSDFNKKSWQVVLSRHLRQFLTPGPSVNLPVTVKQDGVAVEGYKDAQLTVID